MIDDMLRQNWSTLHSPLVDLHRKPIVTESSPPRRPFSRLASEFFQTRSSQLDHTARTSSASLKRSWAILTKWTRLGACGFSEGW